MLYDLIIVGGGMSGLTAGIYAGRYRMKTAIITKQVGGNILDAQVVENWPGIKKVSGMDLMKTCEEQVKSFDVKIIDGEVLAIAKKGNKKEKYFQIKTNNKLYEAKFIILAVGTKHRKLGLPNEDDFTGKGLSYCATCDAPFYKDKTVVVVGGSNSAARSAQLLTEYAKKVIIIYRQEKLRAEPVLVEELKKNKKISYIFKANITKLNGKDFLESVDLDNGKNLKVDGVFLQIGYSPAVDFCKTLRLKCDEQGFFAVNEFQETNVKGVYASGDITSKKTDFRQLINAAAEGAIAASQIYKSLNKKHLS